MAEIFENEYKNSPNCFLIKKFSMKSGENFMIKLHRYQINVFALTWISYVLLYLTRKNFSVAKSVLNEDAGLSVAMLGTIDTCFLVVYAAGQFLSGYIADKAAARIVIAIGLWGSAVFSLGFSLADNALFMAIFFAFNGLFQSTGWSTNIKAIEPWFDIKNRGKVISFWSTNQQVGGLLGTICAAFLLVHYGWRAAFFVPAILVFLMAFLVFFGLAERPPEKSIDKIATDDQGNFRAILADPALWSLSLAYFGLKLIRYSLLFWLPFYLHQTLNLPADTAGYLTVSFEIGGIVGTLIVGFIADKYFSHCRARLIIPLFLLLALALYLYRDFSSVSIVMNCALLALVGAFVFGPDFLISGACAQDLGKEKMTGRVAGFINGAGSLGAILQGATIAYVSTAWGWASVFYFLMAIALLSLLMMTPFMPNLLAKQLITKPIP
jgi:sugar phosphate permease